MRVVRNVPSIISNVCVWFYNETDYNKCNLAEWGVTTCGQLKHWGEFCIQNTKEFYRWHNVCERNKQCLNCHKEIPPGVELALQLHKGR